MCHEFTLSPYIGDGKPKLKHPMTTAHVKLTRHMYQRKKSKQKHN